MQPRRIQRMRTKGAKMPEGAVYVGRPGIFGNPWTVKDAVASGFFKPGCEAAQLVREFRRWLVDPIPGTRHDNLTERRAKLLAALPSLRGKDLACWCPTGSPCHADVLLELANSVTLAPSVAGEGEKCN